MADRIKELRALLAKATPGEWKSTGAPENRLNSVERPLLTVANFTWGADANLTDAMKTALPLLLDVAEAARNYWERAEGDQVSAAEDKLDTALAALEGES